VIPPAKTGKDKSRRIVVKNTDHTNNGVRSLDVIDGRIFIVVVMKLILPMIEEAPAKCRLRMAKSTLLPLCPKLLERGG
jgi:hypothetical protein